MEFYPLCIYFTPGQRYPDNLLKKIDKESDDINDATIEDYLKYLAKGINTKKESEEEKKETKEKDEKKEEESEGKDEESDMKQAKKFFQAVLDKQAVMAFYTKTSAKKKKSDLENTEKEEIEKKEIEKEEETVEIEEKKDADKKTKFEKLLDSLPTDWGWADAYATQCVSYILEQSNLKKEAQMNFVISDGHISLQMTGKYPYTFWPRESKEETEEKEKDEKGKEPTFPLYSKEKALQQKLKYWDWKLTDEKTTMKIVAPRHYSGLIKMRIKNLLSDWGNKYREAELIEKNYLAEKHQNKKRATLLDSLDKFMKHVILYEEKEESARSYTACETPYKFWMCGATSLKFAKEFCDHLDKIQTPKNNEVKKPLFVLQSSNNLHNLSAYLAFYAFMRHADPDQANWIINIDGHPDDGKLYSKKETDSSINKIPLKKGVQEEKEKKDEKTKTEEIVKKEEKKEDVKVQNVQNKVSRKKWTLQPHVGNVENGPWGAFVPRFFSDCGYLVLNTSAEKPPRVSNKANIHVRTSCFYNEKYSKPKSIPPNVYKFFDPSKINDNFRNSVEKVPNKSNVYITIDRDFMKYTCTVWSAGCLDHEEGRKLVKKVIKLLNKKKCNIVGFDITGFPTDGPNNLYSGKSVNANDWKNNERKECDEDPWYLLCRDIGIYYSAMTEY
jgi:hypothetical protein